VVDAILGTEVNIETIYGESKKIKISPGTQNGEKIKIQK
jgi:DnaJ-class molecular chaperone